MNRIHEKTFTLRSLAAGWTLAVLLPGVVFGQQEEIRRAILISPRTSIATGPYNMPEPEIHGIERVEGSRPRVRIARTESAPVIDGRLDEPAWQTTASITNFIQVDPGEGAKPTEDTEVRLLYTADAIYIGVSCKDREPGKIIAKQLQHDPNMESDDSVTLTLDTFGRQRGGYLFSFNPAGAKLEGLIEEDGEINANWDAIWDAACRVDEGGWTAEIAIPFKSLSFDPGSTAWGFNIERVIRRKQEKLRWSGAFRNKKVTTLSDFGVIENLSGINKGLGLDIKPFIAMSRQSTSGGNHEGSGFKPGVDVFYSITSSLTASLTINTDFAEVESDDRMVNLTRFPLFFPEKRDFFLQDANLFGFNAYAGPLPFYSRRIGLTEAGEVVDIIAGAKVTGRVGKLDIGLLDVQTDNFGDIESKNLSVARLSYRILDESSIGGIFTYGDPRNVGSEWLGGVDFNYRNSHVFGNNVLIAQLWGLETGGGRSGTHTAFGGAIRYPNDPFWGEIYAARIGRGFDPPLGFVQRSDVNQYGGYFRYRWHPDGYIRYFDLEATPKIYTSLAGDLQSGYLGAPALQFVNQRGDSLYLGLISSRENLLEPFEIHPGVVIPRGEYSFEHGFASLTTTTARPVSAFASVDSGAFYNGRSDQFVAGLEWRPNQKLFFGTKWEYDRFNLPAGDFDVVVASARMNIAFNARLSWNNLIQFDNISKTLGFYSRLKWIVRPGSELYLVFKNGVDVENHQFRSLSTEVATKIFWTWRF